MKKQKGFTLIETLIYLALFAILMSGIGVTVYAVIEGAGRGQTKIMVQEEGGFLLGKINWALAGASSATATPSTLTISRYNYPLNPLVFGLNGTTMTLKEGSGTTTPLNSDDVKVTNLLFTNIPALNGRPQGIIASATLTSITPNGAAESQDFSITKYLRK